MGYFAVTYPTAAELLQQYPQCNAVFGAICDQNGILRGKRYPLAAIDKVFHGQSRLPLSLCNLDIWGNNITSPLPDYLAGDRDGNCNWTGRLPLPTSWLNNQSLLIPLSLSDDNGEPFLGDPRHVLEWMLNRFNKAALTPVVAIELEFYLTVIDDETPRAPTSPLTGAPLLPSSALPLSELEHFNAFIDDVYHACEVQNIKLDAAIAECGAGQFEINLVHSADVLKAADDALYFKRLIKSVARKHGMVASFMAKPYPDQPGSGMHIHFNFNDDSGRNIFADGTTRGSEHLAHAVAGALDALIDCSLIFAPHLNSYRRFEIDSHAPTHSSWGHENRAAAIRIPGGNVDAKRIEHRVAGADANPYLTTAAVLGASLAGVQSNQNPPAEFSGLENNASEFKPLIDDWHKAQQTFAESAVIKNLLPQEFIYMFDACKRQEIKTFKNHVSAFEINTYLENT